MTYSKLPHKRKAGPASAKAVVFAGGDKVLLLKKPNGKWDLPGGKLEKGEAWIEGLAREVYEETGLKIVRARWVAGWKKKCSKHERAIKGVFLCRLDRKSKKSRIEISDEHVKGGFFSLKQIKNLFLPQEYAEAICLAARKIGA